MSDELAENGGRVDAGTFFRCDRDGREAFATPEQPGLRNEQPRHESVAGEAAVDLVPVPDAQR